MQGNSKNLLISCLLTKQGYLIYNNRITVKLHLWYVVQQIEDRLILY